MLPPETRERGDLHVVVLGRLALRNPVSIHGGFRPPNCSTNCEARAPFTQNVKPSHPSAQCHSQHASLIGEILEHMPKASQKYLHPTLRKISWGNRAELGGLWGLWMLGVA